MDSAHDTRTSATLLGRLRLQPLDQAAWGEFVDRYGPRVYHWCRRWHLQPADAADVTQEVLVRLARAMQTFTYDPAGSFRAWLHTLTRHALSDFIKSQARDRSNGRRKRPVATLEAADDLAKRVEEEFDRELLDEAMNNIRPRVREKTWDAFRLMKLEGLSGAEAARQLGLNTATVYVYANRVMESLREEVERLKAQL